LLVLVEERTLRRPARKGATLSLGVVATTAPHDRIARSESERSYIGRLHAANARLTALPGDRDALIERARALVEWKRWREASDAYDVALKDAPDQDLIGAALAFSAAGRLVDAERLLLRALESDPGSWRLQFELGRVFQSAGQHAAAIERYKGALALAPGNFNCLTNCGICWISLGNPAEAVPILRRCTELEADNPKAWVNYSVALSLFGRTVDALEAIGRAEILDANHDLELFVQKGIYLSELGRMPEAISLLERNLPQNPDPNGHYLYAHMILREGRFAEGWEQNEFRWLVEPLASLRGRLKEPEWRGQDLRGRTILLRPEQGLGDALQFIRYAPMVKALGATVLFQSWRGLDGLSGVLPGVDGVVPQGTPLPRCDYWAQLMSLPAVFGTEVDSIPAHVPYLSAPRDRVEAWRIRLAATNVLKVGLAWAGNPKQPNDARRSMVLSRLNALFEVDGVQFYALQKGPREDDAADLPSGKTLVRLGPEFRDLGDAAAAVFELDLVISVCTAMAHLAGALGKPVWVLLSEPADWRWLINRNDSPWYPTARLFRQRESGDWHDVVVRVRDALRDHVSRSDRTQPAPKPASRGPIALPNVAHPAVSSARALSAVARTRYGVLQYFPDADASARSVAWYGEWLQPQLDSMARCGVAGATVLEVGAGVGAHSVALAEAIGASGHLMLYEKRPQMRRLLRQNLAANRHSNITAMTGVIGDPFVASGATEKLDDLQLDRLEWLKINAGAEAQEILRGGQDTLWRLRPRLLVSARDDAAFESLAEEIESFGYRCWRIAVPLFSPANFNRREHDIFDGGFELSLWAAPEESDVGAFETCIGGLNHP